MEESTNQKSASPEAWGEACCLPGQTLADRKGTALLPPPNNFKVNIKHETPELECIKHSTLSLALV